MRIQELMEAMTEVIPLDSETIKMGSQGRTVKAWQWTLKKLTDPAIKIDGKFGEETKQSTVDFQNENNITNDGVVGKETYSMANRELADAGITSVPFLTGTPNTKDIEAPKAAGGDIDTARTSAEKFLGRDLDDQEWNYLLRATFAESSPNTKEQAYIMGVILNRTKSGKWGNSVIDVLKARNQFQAVTGTKFKPGPSGNFKRGPSPNAMASIIDGVINVLPTVPSRLMNFTAASSAAYGKGTNIRFRDTLLAKGGVKIGGTIFA